MKYSFLETQITAKYYAPGQMAAQTSGRCEILNSQGQEFLSFRMVEDFGADMTCKYLASCCFKQSLPETSKSIGSHSSFGDVINSQQISHEICALFCSSKQQEAFYSGDELLGSFEISKNGPSSEAEGFLLDASSKPLMCIEINLESFYEVYR